MDLDVETFLTTVYCVCDDLSRERLAPALAGRPGARGKLADSEVLALAALAQWEPHRCEHCFLRYARAHWRAAYGVTVLTKADYEALTDPTARERWRRWLNGLRQDAETAFAALTDQLGAKFPRARSAWGLWTRLAAKVVAFNLAVYVNHRLGRPTFALFNPLL